MSKHSVLCIVVLLISSVMPCFNYYISVDKENLGNVTRIRRQTEGCGSLQLKCKSGECIDIELYCDGLENCKDGSDETEDCKSLRNGCRLPAFPEHGGYVVHELETFKPGVIVQPFAVIRFFCENGYGLYPQENRFLICSSGKWDQAIPQCRRVCSTLSSTEWVKVTCTIGDRSGEKYCTDPVESTIAMFSCQNDYEKAGEANHSVHIAKCEDGDWDNPTTDVYACNCIPDTFRCKSGQCIDTTNLCDGKLDCNDHSDEEACRDFYCRGFQYRCTYGACVDGDAKCNGIFDCFDGSDEEDCHLEFEPLFTTPAPPAVPKLKGCELPAFPENGEYIVPGLATFNPGDIVQLFTVISFSCKTGYRVYPYESNFLVCSDYKWHKDIPQCKQLCSSVAPTETIKVTCRIEDRHGEEYCKDPVESTVATFSCQRYYEKASEADPSIYTTRCENGQWDKPDYGYACRCIPACGKRRGKGRTNIVGGIEAEEHSFPWHVGIYNSTTKGYLCGGSLIYYAGYFVVVTAAHCVSNLQNGKPFPKDNYVVALGKHYRQYDDERDSDSVQYPQIKSIHKHRLYRGELSQHGGDIAIIELKDKVRIDAYVQPVCMNWDSRKKHTSTDGLVVGWGFTDEKGKFSDVLKILEVPILSNEECYNAVREDFKPFVTYDKVCAGFKDEGQSVCGGDSGGGLVVREGTKHYLRGIVSVSQRPQMGEQCDKDSYAGYTDLHTSNYIEFLLTA